MANLLLAGIGFVVALAGATVIAWPIVTRTPAQVEKVSETRWGYNLDLRKMLAKERQYARIGLALVIVGSALQFYAAI